ncbi:MAG: hypothetical protein ACI8PZ_003744 [Myxococcota bacterium]|jgi:hypothetical protein
MIGLLLLLSLPAVSVAAPVLGTSGTCPGTTTIAISSAAPDANLFIVTGDSPGEFVVPSGGCAGTVLGVTGGVTLRATPRADGDGAFIISPDLPDGICGDVIQVLDGSTCEVSNVGLLAEPIWIDGVRLGLVDPDTTVKLADMIVTAKSNLGFFMQVPTAEAWGAIYVFTGADYEATWGPIAVGNTVSVTGRYIEYFDFSEISLVEGGPASLLVTGDAELPPPMSLPADVLATDPEPWESVLVQVVDVEVFEADLGFGEWSIVSASDGSGPVLVDDLIYAHMPMAGDYLPFVQGPLYHSFGAHKIVPRDAADLGL